MGSDSSKLNIQRINQNQWTNVKYQKDVEIVRSNRGNGEGEIRMISLDPKHSIEKEQGIYGYRRDTTLPLVKCYGVDFSKSEQSTMCGNQKNVKVLTERIPTNLQNVRTLSFPESLYVISQSLAGFEDLHRNTGIFDINGKMIGFNNSGQVKVWLNQNYAQNHPPTQRPILQTTMTNPEPYTVGVSGEQRMVETLIGLVENKCQKGRFPVDFDNALLNKTKKFHEAYNGVRSYIIDHRNLSVPSRIDLKASKGHVDNRIQKMIDNPKIVIRDQQSKIVNYDIKGENNGRTSTGLRSKSNIKINYNSPARFESAQSPRIISQVLRENEINNYNSPKTVQPINFSSTGHNYSQPYQFGVVSGAAQNKVTIGSRPISINYSSPASYYNPQVRYY